MKRRGMAPPPSTGPPGAASCLFVRAHVPRSLTWLTSAASAVTWLADETTCDWRSRNTYGCNAGQWAAQHGDLRVCTWLLERGLDWGVINCNGHSCLHKAAIKGQAEVCSWLLDCAHLGLPHMSPDDDGNTPDSFARQEGFIELADALVARRSALQLAHQPP